MEYYNKQICISAEELTRDDRTATDQSDCLAPIISYENYKKQVLRGKITVLRQGKGKGNYALVSYDSLSEELKGRIKSKYGSDVVALCANRERFASVYRLDADARSFYSQFRFPDGGILPLNAQEEYTVNASVLRAVIELYNGSKQRRKLMQGSKKTSWQEMLGAIRYYREEVGHTLPESAPRFASRVKDFQDKGYESLISKKYRNQNTRKVDYRTERLLVSLASMPNRPFQKTVWDLYIDFLEGRIEVFDKDSGECFHAPSFKKLSRETVGNYLGKQSNDNLLMYAHESQHEFNSRVRPHHLRRSPEMAFSKISLDDRDLPRKMHNGQRVKAYYAYDVVSGCVIGYAYNRKKNRELFLGCIRNMFQLIEREGWMVPAQVEVEHHLVREFADGLMQAGEIFPFVRWCNPGNSQEKRAEHFNGVKKKTVEKRNHQNIGRWYARQDAYRTKSEKVFDEDNDNYREKTYDYEVLVEEDIRDIEEYNHSLHPNQKKYAGLTRWQVLSQTQNPELRPMDKAVLYRYIGECTSTSIRRNMYVQVRGEEYMLPTVEVLRQLEPRNLRVEAYYLPDESGEVSEVFIYQNGKYLGECKHIHRYNEATIEQTDSDTEAYIEQSAYVGRFMADIRAHKAERVGIITKELSEKLRAIEESPTETLTVESSSEEEEAEDEVERLLQKANGQYSPEAVRKHAIQQF